MFFNKSKGRDGIVLTQACKDQASEVEITMDVQISRKNDSGYGHGENATIAKVSFTKSLLSSTDAPIRDIEREVGALVESSADDLFSQMRASRHLSDGFVSESKSGKEE